MESSQSSISESGRKTKPTQGATTAAFTSTSQSSTPKPSSPRRKGAPWAPRSGLPVRARSSPSSSHLARFFRAGTCGDDTEADGMLQKIHPKVTAHVNRLRAPGWQTWWLGFCHWQETPTSPGKTPYSPEGSQFAARSASVPVRCLSWRASPPPQLYLSVADAQRPFSEPHCGQQQPSSGGCGRWPHGREHRGSTPSCTQHVTHRKPTESTYCHEQHAVHGERRVARVKRQSGRERRQRSIFFPRGGQSSWCPKSTGGRAEPSPPSPWQITRVGEGVLLARLAAGNKLDTNISEVVLHKPQLVYKWSDFMTCELKGPWFKLYLLPAGFAPEC